MVNSFLLLQAEGTKELRPSSTDKGNLLLLKGYSKFGMYGASSKEQIKLKIATSGELVYFGFNNKNGKDAAGLNTDQGAFVANVPYRIVAPSGAIVASGMMPNLGQKGNIATWAQATSGPQQLGNATGYDALNFTATEVGDYIIEFDPLSVNVDRLNIHFIDVTVVDLNQQVQLGRLHSQGWQISTESYTNPFNGKVYPYEQGNALYEVNFNGIQPWVFVINFNSKGTANTGDILTDRQSKIGNHTFGEHEVFLNPPLESLYPTQARKASIDISVSKRDCMSSDYCLNFSTNTFGLLEGFIDLNKNGLYDFSLGEVPFFKEITSSGTECITWDGRDLFGNLVPSSDFNVVAHFGTGIMHLPLYDVEHNINGYKIKTVRPSSASDPIIFWDDTEITAGTAIDGNLNLYGCTSATGCHKWKNRGSINDNTALDKQETINTWWYSDIAMETQNFAFPKAQQVQLSLHESLLIHKDTTLCRGENLSFYVYNDGKDHFNSQIYTYDWLFNGNSLPIDLRKQEQPIYGATEIVLKATDRQFPSCISYDTLKVQVVDPIKLTYSSSLPACGMTNGSLQVQLLPSDLHPQILWGHDPTEKSLQLNNLPKGTYGLLLRDPQYPGCSTDTTIALGEQGGVLIDTLQTTTLSCDTPTGRAMVLMQDLNRNYEYSWNGAAYGSDNTLSGIQPGLYAVRVREIGTGCTDEKLFRLAPVRIPSTLQSTPEICNNAQGTITVNTPPNFNVLWNGLNTGAHTQKNLKAGTYTVTVVSATNTSCKWDSLVTITNKMQSKVLADFSYEVQKSPDELKIYLQNKSRDFVKSSWIFGDGTQSSETNPTHSYTYEGVVGITLTVVDSNGCESTIQKGLQAFFKEGNETCGINLPNAFTPNADAHNDDIGILGYAPKVELVIYNRWGEAIFRTFEIEKRWDGSYREEQSQVGVYPYVLTWECPNAEGIMIKYKKVGDISLLR